MKLQSIGTLDLNITVSTRWCKKVIDTLEEAGFVITKRNSDGTYIDLCVTEEQLKDK